MPIERFAAIVGWKTRRFAVGRLGVLACDSTSVVLTDGTGEEHLRCRPAEVTFTPVGGVAFVIGNGHATIRVKGPIDSLAENHRAAECAQRHQALITLPFRTEETMRGWERWAIKTHGRQLGAGAGADARWQRRQWREIWRNELSLAGVHVEAGRGGS